MMRGDRYYIRMIKLHDSGLLCNMIYQICSHNYLRLEHIQEQCRRFCFCLEWKIIWFRGLAVCHIEHLWSAQLLYMCVSAC